MKFNISAKKLDGVDINFNIELTPEEMIGVMKQGSEDLKTLLIYKDEIVDGVSKILKCYADNVIKNQKHIEEVM